MRIPPSHNSAIRVPSVSKAVCLEDGPRRRGLARGALSGESSPRCPMLKPVLNGRRHAVSPLKMPSVAS
jgi:hypothetical protein